MHRYRERTGTAMHQMPRTHRNKPSRRQHSLLAAGNDARDERRGLLNDKCRAHGGCSSGSTRRVTSERAWQGLAEATD